MCKLTGASFLEAALLQYLFEQLVLGQQRQPDVDSCPDPGAQVAGTGQYEAQMFVPHELVTGFLDVLLHLAEEKLIKSLQGEILNFNIVFGGLTNMAFGKNVFYFAWM